MPTLTKTLSHKIIAKTVPKVKEKVFLFRKFKIYKSKETQKRRQSPNKFGHSM